ncbi:hypothetical protein F5Y04DRAFT_260224 [Hypomontagnella monticulosa]|nr:hypothetical protein F5Y04DRAFT_260224 [Hypomontagnella monticulosa]
MGTRNLICIRMNRQWVVAKYCQYDGYATGQGVTLFKFLHVEENIARLRAGLAHIYEPTEDEMEKIGDDPRELGPNKEFPSVSRAVGAQVLELIANATTDRKLPIQSELEFAADTIYCEWAYIVDLDEEQLKVFGGRDLNREGNPFEEVCCNAVDVPKLVASLKFTDLRNLDEESFKERAEDMEKSCNSSAREHNVRVRKMLAENGIFLCSGIQGDDADEDDNGGANLHGDTEDINDHENVGVDVNGHNANQGGADVVSSQVDQLHLD